MALQFLHFDTRLRTDPKDDPFNCTLMLASPLRNIKKIYLKSCEIPLGFFNFRSANEFKFTAFKYDSEDVIRFKHATVGDTVFMPIDNHVILTSFPVAQNYYFSKDIAATRTITTDNPVDGSLVTDCFPLTYKITVPAGNFSIESLITYINDEIKALNLLMRSKNINNMLNEAPISVSTLSLNDSSSFPVGFVRLMCELSNVTTQVYSDNQLTTTILGFDAFQQNTQTIPHITANKLWGLYNDLAIYLYFPTIPHNNTHFGSQLLSFKIPMSAGYQAIAFNADSQNFSQYIELSDPSFILNSLKINIYDTRGNLLVNQYNWHFTLGFERY